MKILYIHHGRVLGGAPTSLLFTIQGLHKISDCEVKVLCVFDEMKEFFRKGAGVEVGEIHDPCLIFGRILIGWASIYNITTVKQLLKEVFHLKKSINLQIEAIEKEKPDIVHLNSSILFTTAIAAYKLKIPVIWHVREILYGKRFNLRKVFSGYLIRKYADRVIAIDNAEARSLGRDKFNNVEVIHNSVDFTRFDYSRSNNEVERKKYGVKEGENLIISLGGVSWRKGALELIESMRYLPPSVKLLIAGADVIEKNSIPIYKKLLLEIENLLVMLNLKKNRGWIYNYRVSKEISRIEKDRIVFVGMLENVVPLIGASDIVVVPYTFPHSARPIFEAWAMKKTVVAFDIEGIADIVEDGKDGVLVKKRAGTELAKSISYLLNDNEMRLRLAEEGYKKANRLFRQEINAKKILGIYNRIIGIR